MGRTRDDNKRKYMLDLTNRMAEKNEGDRLDHVLRQIIEKVNQYVITNQNSVFDILESLETKALKSTVIATAAPLSGGGDLSQNRTHSIARAGTLSDGYLHKDDFVKFNKYYEESGIVEKNATTSTIFFDTDGSVGHAGTPRTFYIYGDYTVRIIGAESTISTTLGNAEFVQLSDQTKVHAIYYDSSYSLTSASIPFDLEEIFHNGALVSFVYWDSTNSKPLYVGDERHGVEMDWETHKYLHIYFRTQYKSGLGITISSVDGSGDLAINAQIGVNDGVIADEDVEHVITGGSPQTLTLPAEIPILYRDGPTSWGMKTGNSYSVLYSDGVVFTGPNGRLPYNVLSGSTWSLTQVGNLNYVLTHIFATNDINHPIMGIVGQSDYTTLANARAGAEDELNSIILSGLPLEEFKFIGTIIYQTSNSYSNVPKARIRSTLDGLPYVDWRVSEFTPGGIVGPPGTTDHALLTSLDYASSGHTGFVPDTIQIITTAPITGGSTLTSNITLSMTRASTTTDGYLHKDDYVEFKAGGGGSGSLNEIVAVAPITGGGTTSTVTLSMTVSASGQNGYLSGVDWATFNAKVSQTVAINTSLPLAGGGDLSLSRTLSITVSNSSQNGYLSSTDWNTFNGKVSSSQIREKLSAARTYYVRTDGNDANTGLVNNASGAFLTIQKAVITAYNLDFGGYQVVIQISSGTYNENVSIAGLRLGAGSLLIQGDINSTAAVVIDGGIGNAISLYGTGYQTIYLRYCKLQATGVSGVRNGIIASGGSSIVLKSVNFGVCGTAHVFCTAISRVIFDTGNYTISGGANCHLYLPANGIVEHNGGTVTISGTPNFGSAFIVLQGLSCISFWVAPTWSGSATGVRYVGISNSIINTAGQATTWLPGNAAGSVASGAQYV